MKKIVIAGIALAISGCGMSKQEREDLAQLTCNIMGESRNIDSAFRIKEINAAREKLGERPFLGTDDEIKDSIFNGFCKELVLNNASFAELKEKVVNQQQQRRREQQVINQRREEERRNVMEQAEAREREEQKAAEAAEAAEAAAAKILNEKLEPKRKLYRAAVENYIAGYDFEGSIPELFDVQWVGNSGNAIVATFTCYESLDGFVRLVLRDDLGEMVSSSHTCSGSDSMKGQSVFASALKSRLLTEKGRKYFSDKEPGASETHNQEHLAMLNSIVESAELHITGPRKYHDIAPSLETSKYYDDSSFAYSPLTSPVVIPLKVQ